jgi:2,3-bisphosphoglycerate-independent phosphoglycerate mutase
VHDLAELPQERIASVSGRYYAMDRDHRWERTQQAFAAIVGGEPTLSSQPLDYVTDCYKQGVTDEFIVPAHFSGRPAIEPGDTVVFFNFRPDRGRQLSRLLVDAGFDLTTMTRYSDDLDVPVVFGEQTVANTMAELLAKADMSQLHCAETEKYAHVTYFFNGGREEEWPGERRLLVPSPRDVGTYDQKPEMSAPEVARRFAEEIGGHRFGVVNFANPDMVGHTGSIPAVVAACETVDRCLGEVVAAVQAAGGVCIVTADHGNAERELQDDGTPHTAHTTNPVPVIVTQDGIALRDGELSDLVPTALGLLGLEPAPEMTGRDLRA